MRVSILVDDDHNEMAASRLAATLGFAQARRGPSRRSYSAPPKVVVAHGKSPASTAAHKGSGN
jgi:hypothetical protein